MTTEQGCRHEQRFPPLARENPDLLTPPRTDHGLVRKMFKYPRYEDVSLKQWLALIPPELVQAHLHLPQSLVDNLPKQKQLVTC